MVTKGGNGQRDGLEIGIDIYTLCVCAQSCLTFCDPMDYNLPGSSVHGIFQARMLEWVAISYSRGIFLTQGSRLHLLHFLHWQAYSLYCATQKDSKIFYPICSAFLCYFPLKMHLLKKQDHLSCGILFFPDFANLLISFNMALCPLYFLKTDS